MAQRDRVTRLVEKAAFELIHRHSLDEVESVLVSEGASHAEAGRLVLLIPSAFAREHYEPRGIKFPLTFFSGPVGSYTEHSYSAEPFYEAARFLCRTWLEESSDSLVLRVLDWSAEANAIKEADAKGVESRELSVVHHGFEA